MLGKSDEITTLNSLTATLIDSVTGFRDAAENTDDPQLRQLFLGWAERREQAAEELRSLVSRLGGDPRESGSLLGQSHQRFLDLKAALTGRDREAILNEVDRGEDYLKEKFATALSSGELAGENRAVVEQVNQVVGQGHDEMSRLKHSIGDAR